MSGGSARRIMSPCNNFKCTHRVNVGPFVSLYLTRACAWCQPVLVSLGILCKRRHVLLLTPISTWKHFSRGNNEKFLRCRSTFPLQVLPALLVPSCHGLLSVVTTTSDAIVQLWLIL